ncbi:flagellin [Bosea sp. (in: a-proteobacteria)]|uniref:flagellin N-terminal helical domain-containing protein n=1 Tax=Bosea sp. (in: a-proteobacteria) TaxID=1871050 RepID=UPI001AD4140A|nr:flagellin [Bosea sp. (in: a-proteobacteria)]MBN9435991.1 flagellin [Bosea sp. (in: a-proteobacteria)]MBN9449657.1 flagellin [Bosea sp. (in: a-proteobacteria)]
MATVSLSAGVRSALTSLSQTTAASQQGQYRLATGKKVNSAVDNPVNYFTAAGLNDRAGQMTNLLDGISNGIQTIQAASQGLDSAVKLVESLQSTVKQAQADAAANRPTKTGTALATSTEVTATGGKSLKDIALDKRIGKAGAVVGATASDAGHLIDTTTNTNLALTVSAGSTTFTVDLAATATVRDLVNTINSSGLATASVDDSGRLNVTGMGSDTLRVGLGASTTAPLARTNASSASNQNGAIGLAIADGDTAGAGIAASGGNSTVRSNLIKQFNDLTKQIDQLAKDASFNGKNLLAGDKLSIVFNEKTGTQQAKLDVQGSVLTSANLGVLQASTADAAGVSFNIQNDTSLETASDTLTNALTSLRSMASSLGSSMSVVQTRQDFTKNLVNTLTQGADNLVLADSSEEGAKLLALQTRQQLSQTALSLASQADQAVLRLF